MAVAMVFCGRDTVRVEAEDQVDAIRAAQDAVIARGTSHVVTCKLIDARAEAVEGVAGAAA
jgi:hypothetical protein